MNAPGRCRKCLSPVKADDHACPACGASHSVRHAELDTLSIAHIDCDAFFAAIEKRDDPSLEHKPVIVGGGKRGVVATCCYVARLYGVRSAMPMFKALKACPDAVVIRPRMGVYAAEGKRIREMMQAVTPLVEPLSIDEAFMDLSGTDRLHGAPPALTLLRLQRAIKAEIGVSVSVGLSFNKFLAKTASELDKPNGFAVIGRGEAPEFLRNLAVSAVYGVGPATARKLEADGLKTLADVLARPERELVSRHGETGWRLLRLARGEDARPVNPERERKSVSAETTFDDDVAAKQTLKDRLWPLCVKVADRMKAQSVAGRVVTLKLKTDRFRTITRRRTLNAPAQLADTLFRHACELLDAEPEGVRYRLIGAGYGDLTPAAGDSGDLADPNALRRATAERAMDAARAKFGDQAVVKGRVLRRGE
ncbi:DNA polymerase IV [Alkalicaulis satelles]|uniref:DNA polymerase IV n=1 Tax=Alkalicaulis satelles TaxID=2609175 RepID=A0A5M6ZAG5_9PROT|nr:DNA polymerase IV [Alkalicaulis satelles]KAA5801693.1 DNA polymerase IV [Alkalicaulis satelles]